MSAFQSITSALQYENYQQPSYSLLTGYTLPDLTINNTGNYDMTGYSSLAGFNNQKSTQMVTVRMTWPSSGIGSGDFVAANFNNEFVLTGGTLYYNAIISLTESNTRFTISTGTPGGGSNLVLTGSYSQYVDRWLTVVWSTSNSVSDFTNWASTTSGSQHFARTAVYDTVTGELLGKQDFRSSFTYPDFATVGSSLPAGSAGGANPQYLQTNCYGSGTEAVPRRWRQANWWFSIGTMWDPLSVTDQGWRTQRPSRDIGTARAWYNLQMTDYVESGSPVEKYVKTQGMDLYSQADNKMTQTGTNEGYQSGLWTTVFSDTIYTSTRG